MSVKSPEWAVKGPSARAPVGLLSSPGGAFRRAPKKDTMSVRLFCVDGTNLVRIANGYGGPAHAAQEAADSERTVQIFAQLCEETGPAVEVELFFDGAYRAMPSGGPANFRLTFTREVSADDVILDRVRARAWSKGGTTTVVTADVELGETAEAEGGKWMRVAHGTSPDRVARQIGGRFLR